MPDEFETKVRQQVERLTTCSYATIERQVAKKRLAWFSQHHPNPNRLDQPSPRSAFELIFFEYMHLAEDDVPVVLETDTEIVWLSLNKCPTLEACKNLGLDTKQVCRAAYEKSTQALVSQLDPQLRFLRSYEEIRPYWKHCREMIVRVDFDDMMAVALEEAKISTQTGCQGNGAVVALGNRIIGRAHDTAVTEQDPKLHAEANAIRQAVHTLGDTNLSGALLFSTCEPCPMCFSLAAGANLTTIVYGVSIQETAQPGKSGTLKSLYEIDDQAPAMIEVIGGVLGSVRR